VERESFDPILHNTRFKTCLPTDDPSSPLHAFVPLLPFLSLSSTLHPSALALAHSIVEYPSYDVPQ
jgi:hypothetical protein